MRRVCERGKRSIRSAAVLATMTDLPQESGSPEKEGNGHAGHAQDGHDEGDERGLSPRTLPPQASLRRRQSIVEKPTSKEEWDAFVLR